MSQVQEIEVPLSQSFRAAMGCFTTGVTVVTSCSTTGPVGMTANSLTSVSLDPSLLLVCLKKGGLTGRAVRSHNSFAINLLSIAQADLALRFARPSDNRFDGVEVTLDTRGVPLICGSAAHIVCDLYAVHDAGDHEIFLGQVVSSVFDSEIEPLVFRAGRFGTYRPAVPA